MAVVHRGVSGRAVHPAVVPRARRRAQADLSRPPAQRRGRAGHANPNVEDADPDLDIPALAFTPRQSRTKRGFLRWMAKYQAFLFFPLLFLEGLNLHWSSIQAVWRGEVKARKVETVLLTAHLLAYLTAVFLVLSPGKAFVFIAVHQGLWGLYMGCAFAPNHKGMLTLSKDNALDFPRKQVLTSHNVLGGRWVDFTLGGPTTRSNTTSSPTCPGRTCDARSHSGLFRSYGHILSYLHSIGAPPRADRARS